MNQEELNSHIQDLLDGVIHADHLALLEQELSRNPEAVQHYLAYVDLNNLLEVENEVIATQSASVIPIDRIINRQNRQSRRFALLAAAAVLVIGLITMQLFFIDTTQPPALAFKTSPGTQFTISHDGAEDKPVGQTMESGSRLKLSQGSVELTFSSGVKSIVMAPADLTLYNDKQLYMNQGTAWFQVPKGAEGFQVNTKDLNIVDLGTEFGVLAKPNEHDEVHVLKGKVQVTTTRVRKESTILTAGQSRRIDPIGRLDTIPVEPSAFLTTLPKSLPYLHWSFDQSDGIEVKGNHPAAIGLNTDQQSHLTFTEGVTGNALSLDGQQHLITNWSGFNGTRPRTVSFWLKIPANADYRLNPGIIGWGDRTQKNGKWKITLQNQGTETLAQIRLSWGSSWITSIPTLTPNQWQHITITSTGELNTKGLPQADIYLNGKSISTVPGAQGPRESTAPKTTTITHQAVPMMIGCDLYPTRGHRKFFTGEIDELTIFDGYMTAEDVEKLISQ